jgi:hypothetical protein
LNEGGHVCFWHIASFCCAAKFGRYWVHSGHWPGLVLNSSVAIDLVLALDSVLPINGAKLFRHLPDHREKPNVSADGFVFHRLPGGKLESHAITFQ